VREERAMGDTEHGTWSSAELGAFVQRRDARYAEWIAQNVKGDGFGECAEVTERMAAAFPELRRVRGHYYDAIWGERGHWWLVGADGAIVDPTKGQFPTRGTGVYVPWKDGEKEPTGICMDCSSACYDGDYFCSKECERATVSYLNSGSIGRI